MARSVRKKWPDQPPAFGISDSTWRLQARAAGHWDFPRTAIVVAPRPWRSPPAALLRLVRVLANPAGEVADVREIGARAGPVHVAATALRRVVGMETDHAAIHAARCRQQEVDDAIGSDRKPLYRIAGKSLG